MISSRVSGHRGWRPGDRLTRIEYEMLEAASGGDGVDHAEGQVNLATMKAWGPRQTVRAAVLRHLLAEEEWPVHAKGVRLRGVRLTGHLDLEAATLRCPLRLEHCYFSNSRPVNLDYASVSLLTLTRCHLAGLTGDTLRVTKEIDLTGSTFTSRLWLLNADITGQLICSGARLTGDHGYALVADGIKAADVFLDQGFTAAGPVRLRGADITGQLDCGGAQLTGTDGSGNALFADSMKAGYVFLGEQFTAAGAVRMPSADITGQLNCSGAQLTGADRDGNALFADWIKAGSVILGEQFTAAGAVRLLSADITGQLNCRGAQLTGADRDGNALVADGIKAGSIFGEQFTAAGAVQLTGAGITGQLNCTGAKLTGTDGSGNALVAEHSSIGGHVVLGEQFTAAGAVQLTGADITGRLICSGAQLTGTDGSGNTLVADGMKAADVLLDQGFTAAGAVRLLSADITGQLNCSGAQLTGTDRDGDALVADGIKAGSVFLGEQFTAAGAVRLPDADITGQLNCTGAQLTGADRSGTALFADRIKAADVFLTQGFTAAGAVRLRGADITGQLNCTGAQLTGTDRDGDALVADRIKAGSVILGEQFTTVGAVRLPNADIAGQLVCRGARLNGADGSGNVLVADGVRVGGDVFLDQEFTAAGAVWLPGADITGQLNCRGARLTGADGGGNALVASGIRVGGDVFLDQEFTAAGAVWLPGADITGQLNCRGAQLTGINGGGNALVASGIRVGGDVFLDQEFTAAGALWLPGADITGQLTCRGARLNGTNGEGQALVGDWMKASSVFLDKGFTAAGAVRLRGADIASQLKCSGARLTGADGSGNALLADGISVGGDVLLDEEFAAAGTLSLRSARVNGSLSLKPSELADEGHRTAIDAAGAQIVHTLRWAPTKQVSGLVILEDAAAGQLVDDWTQDAGPTNGYWPSADTGRLRLDGFTYTRTGGSHQATLEQRLAWIGSHSHRVSVNARTPLVTQPYEQLANVYRQAGQDKEARKVAIARRRDLRRYGDLSRSRKLSNWLLDKTIQYGYQTWRVVAGIVVLYVAVLVFLWFARYHNAIVPVQATTSLHPVPTATTCSSQYPCFNPFGYAVDTVIPLINVHQADFWGPNESVSWGTACAVITYLGTGFGWILATLAVAGYTGLARNNDGP